MIVTNVFTTLYPFTNNSITLTKFEYMKRQDNCLRVHYTSDDLNATQNIVDHMKRSRRLLDQLQQFFILRGFTITTNFEYFPEHFFPYMLVKVGDEFEAQFLQYAKRMLDNSIKIERIDPTQNVLEPIEDILSKARGRLFWLENKEIQTMVGFEPSRIETVYYNLAEWKFRANEFICNILEYPLASDYQLFLTEGPHHIFQQMFGSYYTAD